MTTHLGALVDLVATAVALAALITLHALPTGLSPVRNPVSQYGITRYRAGYRVLTLALGVAGLAAATTVATSYPAAGRTVIVGLLVVFALCRLAISWWPMDAPGGRRSTSGSVHLVLAVGAFLPITIAANQMRRALRGFVPPAPPGYQTAVGAAFWLLLVGLVALVAARRLDQRHRYFGAAERVVYAGIFLLLIATGAAGV